MPLRRKIAVSLAALTAGIWLPPGGAAAAPKDDGLSMVVPTLAPMLPGQQGWLSAMWSATKDVCDVKITVAGPGLTVSYPANTTTYTSLYTNSALATGNLD